MKHQSELRTIKRFKTILFLVFLLLSACGKNNGPNSSPNNSNNPNEKPTPPQPSSSEEIQRQKKCLEKHLGLKGSPPEKRSDFIKRMRSNYEECQISIDGTKSYFDDLKNEHPNFFNNWSYYEKNI